MALAISRYNTLRFLPEDVNKREGIQAPHASIEELKTKIKRECRRIGPFLLEKFGIT